MLLFGSRLKRITNEIRTNINKDGGSVFIPPKGFTRRNCDTLADEFADDGYLIAPSFLNQFEGESHSSDSVEFILIANNPAVMWSAWHKFLASLIEAEKERLHSAKGEETESFLHAEDCEIFVKMTDDLSKMLKEKYGLQLQEYEHMQILRSLIALEKIDNMEMGRG